MRERMNRYVACMPFNPYSLTATTAAVGPLYARSVVHGPRYIHRRTFVISRNETRSVTVMIIRHHAHGGPIRRRNQEYLCRSL